MTTAINKAPHSEKLKSIPGFFGIRLEEEPKFFVLFREGNMQIRKCNPFLMAQTFIRGNYEFCANEGFYRLTNYIFGSNSTHEKMAMSFPVLQGRSKKLVMVSPVLHEQKSDGWVMSFILPAKYKFESLPQPLVDNIEIIKVPSLIVATLRYSGVNNEKKIDEKSRELVKWLESKEDFIILSEPRYAQYGPAHGFNLFRRNEIQITVHERELKHRRH
jgi:hypothetical protein